jgi:four helix bundle protein
LELQTITRSLLGAPDGLAFTLHPSALAMTVPESFQDRSFRLALELLKSYRVLLQTTDVPHHFANQVLRAGSATGANLEEARSAYSRRDLAGKFTIGLREARECRYWLRLIRADQPTLEPSIDVLLDEYDQLVAVLTTSVRKLRIATAVLILLVGVAAATVSCLFS